MFFEREMPNPNNEKYLVKTIGYKLQYIIYGSTTTAIANLISLTDIRPRVTQFPPPPPLKLGGGFSFLKFGQRGGGSENIAQKQGGQLKGGVLLERGCFQVVFHQFSLRKACFRYYWSTFLCLVNIHTCCNQQIHSFMWFAFHQKIICYEIYFPFTLIFKYNSVKILLLMTFIFISISLKTPTILENKSQVLESDCTITIYMIFIIMNLSSAEIPHKIKKL